MTKQSDQLDHVVDRLARVHDDELAAAINSPGAQTLLDQILAEDSIVPRELHGRRSAGPMKRFAWMGAAAAIVAGLIVAVALWPAKTPTRPTATGVSPRTTVPELQLVAFTTRGDDIVARITDPLAAAEQLTAAFEAHGLNIHVQTVPVSPSLVGTIVYNDVDSISSLQAGTCLTGGGTSCEVGLVIPADFTGEANVAVGRAAAPDETYGSSAQVFGPGEVLHCSGILGQPAASAVPILQGEALTGEWMADGTRTDDPNPPGGYIIGGTALSSSTVLLDVSSQPPDTLPAFADYEAAANRGC